MTLCTICCKPFTEGQDIVSFDGAPQIAWEGAYHQRCHDAAFAIAGGGIVARSRDGALGRTTAGTRGPRQRGIAQTKRAA